MHSKHVYRSSMRIICLSLSVLFMFASDVTTRYHDYCVIGAGPGGLQMGYFLQRQHRDYVIFERSNISGEFFVLYPRHRRLISINKRFTGRTNREFNMRHDWNTLLSHDESLLFRHYSQEFFPHADDMVRYLNDFSRTFSLNIQYNTYIRNIRRTKGIDEEGNFAMEDQKHRRYVCRTLIVATGLWLPNAPSFRGSHLVEGYEDMATDPELFEGKNILILGRGNSAFETADALYGRTNVVHMVSRSRARLSWSTHYVGDLRAINNGLLDTYQLKSLDGLLEAPVEDMELERLGGRIHVTFPFIERQGTGGNPFAESDLDNFSLREGYDHVFRCLGFKFDDSLFHNESVPMRANGRRSKYPAIKHSYEAYNIPGLFFAGTLAHSLDFRKSAGGFIHGFRYTIRALHRLLEYRNHGIPWPTYKRPLSELLNSIIKRINEAAGLYQMFGTLADIIVLGQDEGEFEVLEEFPVHLLHRLPQLSGRNPSRIIVLVMEYGPDFSGPDKDTFRPDRATGDPLEAHRSNFLHPVFYFYGHLPTEMEMALKPEAWTLPRPLRLHHVLEDFLTTWTAPQSHVLPLRRFLEFCTQFDLRQVFASSCMGQLIAASRPSLRCARQRAKASSVVFPPSTLAACALERRPIEDDYHLFNRSLLFNNSCD